MIPLHQISNALFCLYIMCLLLRVFCHVHYVTPFATKSFVSIHGRKDTVALGTFSGLWLWYAFIFLQQSVLFVVAGVYRFTILPLVLFEITLLLQLFFVVLVAYLAACVWAYRMVVRARLEGTTTYRAFCGHYSYNNVYIYINIIVMWNGYIMERYHGIIPRWNGTMLWNYSTMESFHGMERCNDTMKLNYNK